MKSWTGPDEYYPLDRKKSFANYNNRKEVRVKIVRIYSVVDEKINGEENAMRCSGTDRKGIVGGLNHKK